MHCRSMSYCRVALLQLSIIPGLVGGTPLLAQEPADTNYDEGKVPMYMLPELLPGSPGGTAGRKVWANSRRAEILKLFEEHVYGKTPTEPVDVQSRIIEESDNALNGTAKRRQIRLIIRASASSTDFDRTRSVQIDVLVYSPRNTNGKSPAFIGLNFYGNQTVHPDPNVGVSNQWMRSNTAIGIVNNRATEKTRGVYRSRWQAELLIERGYGLVTAYCGDIDPDNYAHDYSDGVQPLFYRTGQSEPAVDEWGTIGAWAWGLTQIRKALLTDELIDARRLAVIGHSRLGKTALWAGAQDPEFAVVISNNSGCGGAALYRRCYGERLHHMLRPVGYWFSKKHAEYARRESELPVDQHMLMALIAPRPLYVASAVEDRWCDPRGEFLAARHAGPVYELFGYRGLPCEELPKLDQPVAGRIGYHIRSGDHDVTLFDWKQFLNFADKQLAR